MHAHAHFKNPAQPIYGTFKTNKTACKVPMHSKFWSHSNRHFASPLSGLPIDNRYILLNSMTQLTYCGLFWCMPLIQAYDHRLGHGKHN